MKIFYDDNDDLSFIENDKVVLFYDMDILDFISSKDIRSLEKEMLLAKFKDELTYLKFSIKKSPILDKIFKDSDFETIEKGRSNFLNVVMSNCYYIVYKNTGEEKFNIYKMYVDKRKIKEIESLEF